MTTKLDELEEIFDSNPEFTGLTNQERELIYDCMPHLLAIVRFYSTERDNEEWPTMAMAAFSAFNTLMEPVE